MADVYKIMTFSPGLCGQLALGTLSEAYLKDAVFEINIFRKKSPKMTNFKNVKFDTEIENRIRARYCVVSINTF